MNDNIKESWRNFLNPKILRHNSDPSETHEEILRESW